MPKDKILTRWFRSERLSLIVLLLLALSVRLYRVNNPVLDWHAFRQADTASVTREYVRHGVDLLRPRYHDLSNIQSGQTNLEGWRMVELPLINGLLASLIRAVPSLPLVLVSRLASVTASLATLVFLYLLVKLVTNSKTVAVLSGLFFALLPYSIYYSRVILPEPFMLLTSTAAIYFLAATTNLKKPVPSWQWWLSALLFSLALLIKPFIAFLIPVLLVFWWQTGPRRRWSPWWLVYWSVVILPIWWWRDWILQFPSGIPASDWLFNGNGIRFRPAWFRWLFYERLSKLMLGFGGVFLVTAGMILSSRRAKNLLWTWWASLLAYLSVFATGNVQHDYYQVIFVPWLSFCLGIGTWHTWRQLQLRLRGTRLIIGQVALVLLMLVGWLFSWQQVAGWFNVNHWEYQRAGQAVDQLTPPDAKVIAPAFGDTQFLFQTNRTGWPIGFTIDEKIAQGATYYVTTSLDDEAHSLLKIYALVYRTDEFLILDLENKLP